jgi:hypothetical protein
MRYAGIWHYLLQSSTATPPPPWWRQKRLPDGRRILPAPSNRASGPVRAGKPSRPRSRSLRCVFVRLRLRRATLQLPPPPPHPHWSRSWCSTCSTALADEPLLPSLRKLSPCRFSTIFGPDELAAHVPRGLGDAELLPNTYGLHVAAEGKVL